MGQIVPLSATAFALTQRDVVLERIVDRQHLHGLCIAHLPTLSSLPELLVFDDPKSF